MSKDSGHSFRDAVVAGAFAVSTLGGNGVLEAGMRTSGADPAVRDAVVSMIDSTGNAAEAWRDGDEQREQVADNIEGAYQEPEVVEERQDADLTTDTWEQAETWEAPDLAEAAPDVEAVDGAESGEQSA